MELKDVILSTLQEIDSTETEKVEITDDVQSIEEAVDEDVLEHESEQRFLQNVQERLLVLFEGFQAPNNAKIDAKIDLTLNFLEYLLATIESRLKHLDSKDSL